MTEQWNNFIFELSHNPLNAVFLILGIILLEVILSFDNAAVLATMVKDLSDIENLINNNINVFSSCYLKKRKETKKNSFVI